MTLKPDTERLLRDLKQRLRALYGERLARVVLFGSVARGEDTPYSDVDVLVVLRGPVDRYAESALLAYITDELMARYAELIAPIVLSEEEYRSAGWPLLKNVRAEGIPL